MCWPDRYLSACQGYVGLASVEVGGSNIHQQVSWYVSLITVCRLVTQWPGHALPYCLIIIIALLAQWHHSEQAGWNPRFSSFQAVFRADLGFWRVQLHSSRCIACHLWAVLMHCCKVCLNQAVTLSQSSSWADKRPLKILYNSIGLNHEQSTWTKANMFNFKGVVRTITRL